MFDDRGAESAKTRQIFFRGDANRIFNNIGASDTPFAFLTIEVRAFLTIEVKGALRQEEYSSVEVQIEFSTILVRAILPLHFR